MGGRLAIIYDFDGTLIDGEMVDPILRDLGLEPAEFWDRCDETARARRMDRVCCYMHLLLEEARKQDRPLTLEYMQKTGAALALRPGLEGRDCWFDGVNEACARHGLRAEHYVVTSGLAEIVEATPVAARAARVFGSRFFYGADGAAAWPAQVVNYTTKTQYLFRINKNRLDERDEEAPNDYMAAEDRPVPFENMVFIGDGYTDIPCFSLIKKEKGYAVAVLRDERENAKQVLEKLHVDGRIDLFSLTRHFERAGKLFESIERIAARRGRKAA